MTERVILGQQWDYGNPGHGRRVIGIELRIAPDENGSAQEEVLMDGLDIALPPGNYGYGLNWSVTLHTTNGDVTLDSRQLPQANIRQ
jgi:hypothetical protein